MGKKKTVFLPMTQNEFERSFRENIRHVNVKNDERTSVDGDFVGRISGLRFKFYYSVILGSERRYILSGNTQYHRGGILLTYRCRRPYFDWIFPVFVLCWTTFTVIRDIGRGVEFTFSPESLLPFLLYLPIIYVEIVAWFLKEKPVDVKRRLNDKLRDICGGSLPREEKELERR